MASPSGYDLGKSFLVPVHCLFVPVRTLSPGLVVCGRRVGKLSSSPIAQRKLERSKADCFHCMRLRALLCVFGSMITRDHALTPPKVLKPGTLLWRVLEEVGTIDC